MKKHQIIYLSLFVLFILVSAAFVAIKFSPEMVGITNPDAPFHRNKYSERLEITDLKEIYATRFPKDLRELLFVYGHLDPNEANDNKRIRKFAQKIIKSHHHNHPREAAFYEALDYIHIFSDKFFVYEIEKHEDRSFCGAAQSYRIAVFITERLERFQFYIYKDEKNEYEICDVEWEDMTDWEGFENIESPAYKKYWL